MQKKRGRPSLPTKKVRKTFMFCPDTFEEFATIIKKEHDNKKWINQSVIVEQLMRKFITMHQEGTISFTPLTYF